MIATDFTLSQNYKNTKPKEFERFASPNIQKHNNILKAERERNHHQYIPQKEITRPLIIGTLKSEKQVNPAEEVPSLFDLTLLPLAIEAIIQNTTLLMYVSCRMKYSIQAVTSLPYRKVAIHKSEESLPYRLTTFPFKPMSLPID